MKRNNYWKLQKLEKLKLKLKKVFFKNLKGKRIEIVMKKVSWNLKKLRLKEDF